MSYFIKNLKIMDFDASSEDLRSLLLVSQKNDKTLSPVEVFALEDAEEFQATAVYFRHFPDERSPQPQIYIYDNTEKTFSENDLAHIHRDLWSNSRIPIFLVIEKTDVKIFDTREPVVVSGISGELIEKKPFDVVPFAADAIRQFSRKLFDSGIFWESEKARGQFLESKSAYQDLINELKKIREKFTKKLSKDELNELKAFNKLLVFSILVKYLEERGGLFAEDFFKKINSKNYCDALRNGKVFALFSELSRHFNGRIFEWTSEEKEIINSRANLSDLAGFLDADIDAATGQGFFWRRYSFNHLPVELISTVYETFLSENEDAVFTPEFLVNTLLDEVLPQKDFRKTKVKTIDVSCGSGIFLVGAFKRLAQRHRYQEFQRTGKLLSAKPNNLLKIIKENIFGVDIEDESIRLTVFSLCLALCDELNPKQIWTELRFDDTFQTNFQTQNFFDYLDNNDLNLGTWDLVIGNPPFNGLTIKKDKNGDYYGKFSGIKSSRAGSRTQVKLNRDVVEKIDRQMFPDNQIALMFLDQAPRLLKDNGLVCLILPSAPLLYNNSSEFRKQFFPNCQVLQILDFTNLDSILFGKADVPTAALFARKQAHDKNKPIVHATIRRTKTVEERIFFEVDKYDIHFVTQQNAVQNKHVWKCNLLGGGRLNNLVNRLSHLTSIKDFVEAKKWIYAVGYEVGHSSRQIKSAAYITQQPSLPTTALTENKTHKYQIFTETAEKFHRISDERVFTPPHLLIKTNIGKNKIPTYFSDEYLTFKKVILGISVSKSERDQLLDLSNSFEKYKSIYRFLIASTSNKYLVSRETATLNQDIMNLPYPEDKEDLNLPFAEQIICDDVLDYFLEIKTKSQKAKFNKDAQKDDLESYGEVFTKALNSVYEQADKSFYLNNIYDWGQYFITEFNYDGEDEGVLGYKNLSAPTEDIKSLIETKLGSNFHLLKVIRINERNRFTFIKPKALRFWLRSIALRDADEVFSDLIKAGF